MPLPLGHPMLHALSSPRRATQRYSRFLRRALGIASILVQTALQMGLVLLVIMRWDLPFLSLTLVFGLNAALNVSQAQDYDLRLVVTAAFAGLVADATDEG